MIAINDGVRSVAFSLRRQPLIGSTQPIRVRLDAFETVAHTLNDKRLVAWVKLQLIAEDVERFKTKASTATVAGTVTLQEEYDILQTRFERWRYSMGYNTLNGKHLIPLRRHAR